MRYAAYALALPLLAACASASKTYAPDGRQAFSLDCSGYARSWGMCFKRAGDICRERGYDIYTRDGDSGALVTATEGQLVGGSVMSRTMVIACKQDRE